jgi:hypothetical protein
MSGVYIKDIEMPKSCYDCTMESICNRWALHDAEWQKENRDKDCPLVPVPPHGDLIDRDALRAEVKKHATPSDAWVFSFIRTAPTIIQAEEEIK